MAAVTMHHFSGLGAPFVRSKGTVSGGVFSGLIVTEPTEVITKAGEKRNGNLLFTLRPIQEVIDQYYDRQLEELELATERQRVAKLLREQESPA